MRQGSEENNDSPMFHFSHRCEFKSKVKKIINIVTYRIGMVKER